MGRREVHRWRNQKEDGELLGWVPKAQDGRAETRPMRYHSRRADTKKKKQIIERFQGMTTEAVRNDVVSKPHKAFSRVQDTMADTPTQIYDRAVQRHDMDLLPSGRLVQRAKKGTKLQFAVRTVPVGI